MLGEGSPTPTPNQEMRVVLGTALLQEGILSQERVPLWSKMAHVRGRCLVGAAVHQFPAFPSLPLPTGALIGKAPQILLFQFHSSLPHFGRFRSTFSYFLVKLLCQSLRHHQETSGPSVAVTSSKGAGWKIEPLQAPPMSPLGMNPIRAPGLTDWEPLPSGLASFLPTSC